jgi:hypothetical protein
MEMVEQIDEALWIADGEIVSFLGIPFPTRSVIVRLVGGDLWVWSPVRLAPDLRADLDRLGRVRHLVSPNKMHHLYLKDWSKAYPQAQLWGPQSTIRKCSDLKFREALEDHVPSDWGSDIDLAWFRGSRAMDEIVFLHRPSRTVFVADLIAGFSDEFLRAHGGWWQLPLARFLGMMADDYRAPLDWRLSFLLVDRAPALAARAKILSWGCERVIMAHGEWRRADGHAFLERKLEWLGPNRSDTTIDGSPEVDSGPKLK